MGSTSISDTLESLYGVETDITDQIKGLCNAIHNSTMFTEHQHLLVAALSALKATKSVLHSMSEESVLSQLKTLSEKK